MVFLRLSGIPRIGTLHTCSPYMEPFQTSHRRRYSNDHRSCMDHLFILYPGCARRNSFHTCNRNRMGFLYNQLCASYNGYIPYFHMHQSPKSPTNSNRSIKTQLWHVSHAYILARVVGNSIQTHSGTAYRCGYTLYCSEYIHLLFRNSKDHLIYTGQ